MTFAALRSAFSVWPQATQTNTAWLFLFSAAMWPQAEHSWLVYAGGTAMSITPPLAALYSSMERAMLQPLRRIVRFRPAFWRTCWPGALSVPAAEAVMLLTLRSSTAMRT